MSIKFKFILGLVLWTFLFASTSYSQNIETVVKTCRLDTFCDALVNATPEETPKEIAESNPCFRKKLKACFGATTRGGVWWGSNDLDFTKIILYGNFCGWRNLARNPDGSELDWKNEKGVLLATKALPAIDSLDEICKEHDIKYFTAPYEICEADNEFIQKIQTLVWNTKDPLTKNAREVAMAMSGAISRNKDTCQAISWMKRRHIW